MMLTLAAGARAAKFDPAFMADLTTAALLSALDVVRWFGAAKSKTLDCDFAAGPVTECAGGGGRIARAISGRNFFAPRRIDVVGNRALDGIRRRLRAIARVS